MKHYNGPKNFIIITLLALGFAFAGKQSAFAGFGISPSDIINDHLKPGAHYEKTIVVSRSDPTEDLKGTVEVEVEGANEWFTFNPGKDFLLPTGQERFPVTVIIDVPEDADLKNYSGTLRFTGASLDEEKAGVTIVKGARVQVQLATTDLDVTNLLVRALRFESTDNPESLNLYMYIENIGNTDAAPSLVKLDVIDLADKPIGSFETTEVEPIPAGESKEVTAKFTTNLNTGEYYGLVKVYLGEDLLREERLYFKITVPQVTEETKEVPVAVGFAAEGGKFQQFISKYWTLIALGVGGILLLALILLLLSRRHKESEDKKVQTLTPVEEKTNIALMSIIIILVILAGILFVLVYLTSTDNLVTKLPHLAMVKTTVKVPVDTENTTSESDYSGVEMASTEEITETQDVMGASIQNQNSDKKEAPKPGLTVIGPQSNGYYYIYAQPDLTSQIIYISKDGEALKVFDENNFWYGVYLPDGKTQGWIEKLSVKTATQL